MSGPHAESADEQSSRAGLIAALAGMPEHVADELAVDLVVYGDAFLHFTLAGATRIDPRHIMIQDKDTS